VLTTTTPVGVEYTITPLGHSLREPFEALYKWSMNHGPELERAQDEYDRIRN
jgi:DNA-binding HxlR family transcriptional regulator